jgi:hypothetical protein
MDTNSQRHWADYNEKQQKELAQIIDRPHSEPEEFWNILPQNFHLWRKKYDYPKILYHFETRLNGFKRWKEEFGIDDEFLMTYGISHCLNTNYSKDKRKLIVSKVIGSNRHSFLMTWYDYTHQLRMRPNRDSKIEKEFIGYIDWCNFSWNKIMNGYWENKLIVNPSIDYYPYPPNIRSVSILDGLELLRIGGITVGGNYHLLSTVQFDLVNACNLTIVGQVRTEGLPLEFINSFVDNLQCANTDLDLVHFFDCSVNNINIQNSKIQQWYFYNSETTGKIENSHLSLSKIIGGSFDVSLKETQLYELEAQVGKYYKPAFKDDYNDDLHEQKEIQLEKTYKTLKVAYANQGDDSEAIKYFLLEKNAKRLRLRLTIFFYPWFQTPKDSPFVQRIKRIKHVVSTTSKYIGLSISNIYWGYGRKPMRVVMFSGILILLFGFIYYSNSALIINTRHQFSFADALMYSFSVHATIGDSDYNPIGSMKILTVVEAFLGVLNFGFMIGGFSNSKF